MAETYGVSMSATLPLETYIGRLARAPGKRLPSKLDIVIDSHSMSVSAVYGVLAYIEQSRSIRVERISASGTGALLGCLFFLGAFDKAEFCDLVLAAPNGLRTAALLQYTVEQVEAAKPAQIAALSERLLVSYNDLRGSATAVAFRFLSKRRLLRLLTRACRPPGFAGNGLGQRFCGGAAPRLIDDPSRATLLVSPTHPMRSLVSFLLPHRTDSLSTVLDAVADIHSFFSGRPSLHCSYYAPGLSLPAAWMGMRAHILVYLCGILYRRQKQRGHRSQSEKAGEG